MSHRASVRLCLGLATALVIQFSLSIFGQLLPEQISRESARLKQIATEIGYEDKADQDNLLQEIETLNLATQKGLEHYALHRLYRVWPMTSAYEAMKVNDKIDNKDLDGFEKHWKAAGVELTEQEKQVSLKKLATQPLLVRALGESALTQVHPLYQSSELFGQNTAPIYGRHYLGLAQGNLTFTLYCQNLNLPKPASSPALRSFAPELKKLEAQVIKDYSQPESKEFNTIYIVANVTLKQAWDLEKEKRYAGELFQLLEATRVMGFVAAKAKDPQPLADQQAQLAQWKQRLKTASGDQSLGLMFLEQAEYVQGVFSKSNNPDDLRRSTAVLEHVLPLYASLLKVKTP